MLGGGGVVLCGVIGSVLAIGPKVTSIVYRFVALQLQVL
jgi:hypothetical protein